MPAVHCSCTCFGQTSLSISGPNEFPRNVSYAVCQGVFNANKIFDVVLKARLSSVFGSDEFSCVIYLILASYFSMLLCFGV